MDDDVDAQDTPAEVDATFRTLRRVGVGYFVVFLVAVVGFPALSLSLGWWSDSRVLGGMSPGFLMASLGLYVFFAVLGIAAARLSSAVEARMLGGSAHDAFAGPLAPSDDHFVDHSVDPPSAGPSTDTARTDGAPPP